MSNTKKYFMEQALNHGKDSLANYTLGWISRIIDDDDDFPKTDNEKVKEIKEAWETFNEVMEIKKFEGKPIASCSILAGYNIHIYEERFVEQGYGRKEVLVGINDDFPRYKTLHTDEDEVYFYCDGGGKCYLSEFLRRDYA